MIDQHPEGQAAAERERMEVRQWARRELVYWLVIFAIAVVWALLVPTSTWWVSILVGCASVPLASLVSKAV